MNLQTKIICFCFARGYSFKNINFLVGNIRTLKCSISVLKLHRVWKPEKNILLSKLYHRVLKSRRKAFRNGILFSMAFFSPAVIFTEEKHIKTSEDVAPTFIVQEFYKRAPYKNEPFKALIFHCYEAICIAFRSARLFLTFFPILLLYPISYFGTYPHELWWKLLLIGIEFSGPIFIKFGQWASTRRDLFPETCCNQFSRLQRRTKPHSWHYTKQQLVKAFGKDWRKTFVKFDNNSNPVGSGCIAQVYKVWMNEEHIKNKDIVQEIIQEQDDFDDYRIDFLGDGLEVWGFHQWLRSNKCDKEEETEAISDFKKSRQSDVELQDEDESPRGSFIHDIKVVTEGLAGEILLLMKPNQEVIQPYGKGNRKVSEWGESENDQPHGDMEDDHAIDENHLEHALVEQWQSSAEVLEKSLPTLEEHPDNLDGLVPVALKVLHPRVFRTFRRDMIIFRRCAQFVTAVCPPLKWLSLERCVDEFFEVMAAQIDLRKEADNLDTFIETFSAVETVRFPRPVWPFVTSRVLVETYEEGEPILHFITDEKPDAVKRNLAKIGVDALLKMIFTDNFIHGDLHPGNILVQNDSTTSEDPASISTQDGNTPKYMMVDIGGDTFVLNVEEDPNPLRICILDCGIVAKLKPKDLNNFRAVFQEVVLGNGKNVANLFLENSEHQCQDPETFRREMSQLVLMARQNAITLEQVDVGVLLQQILGLLLRHRIRLESAFSAVVLAVFVLEGLGRSLDPHMDILERARPLLL